MFPLHTFPCAAGTKRKRHACKRSARNEIIYPTTYYLSRLLRFFATVSCSFFSFSFKSSACCLSCSARSSSSSFMRFALAALRSSRSFSSSYSLIWFFSSSCLRSISISARSAAMRRFSSSRLWSISSCAFCSKERSTVRAARCR